MEIRFRRQSPGGATTFINNTAQLETTHIYACVNGRAEIRLCACAVDTFRPASRDYKPRRKRDRRSIWNYIEREQI